MTIVKMGRAMLLLGAIGIPLCIWRLSEGQPLEETPYLGTLLSLVFGAFLVWRYKRDGTD